MRPILVKLVRDNCEKHLPDDAREIAYLPIPDDKELEEHQRRKVVEEATEFAINGSREELADLLTITLAVANHWFDMAPADLMALAAQKNKRMGKFDLGMGMYVNTLERHEFDAKMEAYNAQGQTAVQEDPRVQREQAT